MLMHAKKKTGKCDDTEVAILVVSEQIDERRFLKSFPDERRSLQNFHDDTLMDKGEDLKMAPLPI